MWSLDAYIDGEKLVSQVLIAPDTNSLSIGRSRWVGLSVPFDDVSSAHAELFQRDARLFVQDLSSSNGHLRQWRAH